MTCVIPTLTSLKLEIAFTTDPTSLTPSYADVTAYLLAFTTKRGRTIETDVCDPGTATITLDNSDGTFDPDNTSGTYYGYILPNRKVRISAVCNGTTYYVWTGYVDAWVRTWPGGSNHSLTTVTCTDRFKLIGRRSNLGSTVQEGTDARTKAILLAGGHGANHIIDSTEFSVNPESYTCRTVVGYAYNNTNSLDNIQEMARYEGGAVFMRADGVFRFQSHLYRSSATVSTTSQATFGNTAGAIPVSEALSPTVDDVRFANYVTVADCNGTAIVSSDSTSITSYGALEMNLGSTLLITADATSLAADVLAKRKAVGTRYDQMQVDGFTDTPTMVQALGREISDRITLSVAPYGAGSTVTKDQFIEGIEHEVSDSMWRTTFRLSAP